MMIYVMDSSAMIALANNEPTADVVADLLADPQHECCAHALNLCEVFYDAIRRSDEAQALKIITDLLGRGKEICRRRRVTDTKNGRSTTKGYYKV